MAGDEEVDSGQEPDPIDPTVEEAALNEVAVQGIGRKHHHQFLTFSPQDYLMFMALFKHFVDLRVLRKTLRIMSWRRKLLRCVQIDVLSKGVTLQFIPFFHHRAVWTLYSCNIWI